MHRVDPAGPLWRSAVWGDAGQIVRLHGTEQHATRWARRIDRIMNPDRGEPRPTVPATAAMLRTRIAMLAQTCLARSQATEPAAPQPEGPEPATDLGDPRLGEPGVQIQLNGERVNLAEQRARTFSPGAIYTEAARRYWYALHEILFDMLRRIDARPKTRPMPGRSGFVPCRYRCGRQVEQPALLIAILAEHGLELSVGCGCFTEPDPGPPSEDSEPPPPMPPPPEPKSPHTILVLATVIAAERDAGTQHRNMCAALPLLEALAPPSSEPPPEIDESEPPEERDEIERERSEPELDPDLDREQPDPPANPDDDWIF